MSFVDWDRKIFKLFPNKLLLIKFLLFIFFLFFFFFIFYLFIPFLSFFFIINWNFLYSRVDDNFFHIPIFPFYKYSRDWIQRVFTIFFAKFNNLLSWRRSMKSGLFPLMILIKAPLTKMKIALFINAIKLCSFLITFIANKYILDWSPLYLFKSFYQ